MRSIIWVLFFLTLSILTFQQSAPLRQETQWEKQQRLYINDPYCIRWNGEICAQCSLRYYTRDRRCVPVNPLCNDFDPSNGDCLNCHPGYQVSQGTCIVAQNPVLGNTINQWNSATQPNQWGPSQIGVSGGSGQQYNSNPGCASFDQNGVCLRCSDRQYNDSGTGYCKPVSDFCRTWNEFNGNCLTCYGGFELVNGGCFGNYNPGQPLTVGPGANSRSDQTVIVPLGQTQQANPIYPTSIPQTQPIANLGFQTSLTASNNSPQFVTLNPTTIPQNQDQLPQSFLTPIIPPTQPLNSQSSYLSQISALQPLTYN